MNELNLEQLKQSSKELIRFISERALVGLMPLRIYGTLFESVISREEDVERAIKEERRNLLDEAFEMVYALHVIEPVTEESKEENNVSIERALSIIEGSYVQIWCNKVHKLLEKTKDYLPVEEK